MEGAAVVVDVGAATQLQPVVQPLRSSVVYTTEAPRLQLQARIVGQRSVVVVARVVVVVVEVVVGRLVVVVVVVVMGLLVVVVVGLLVVVVVVVEVVVGRLVEVLELSLGLRINLHLQPSGQNAEELLNVGLCL